MTVRIKLTIADETSAELKRAAHDQGMSVERFIVEAAMYRVGVLQSLSKSSAKRRTTHRPSKRTKSYALREHVG